MDLDPGSWGELELGLKIGPVKTSTCRLEWGKTPKAAQTPTPLFQEWFGLSRKLNSNFADNKEFCIVFFFGGISFKDVVTRREKKNPTLVKNNDRS